jgi:hypothetical protein
MGSIGEVPVMLRFEEILRAGVFRPFSLCTQPFSRVASVGIYSWGEEPHSNKEVRRMAGIGKKIKEAATKAAKEKVSGEKKGEGTKDSESGVDKAKRALKDRLK